MEEIFSKTCHCFSNIINPLLSFQQYSQHLLQECIPSREFLCSFVNSNSSAIEVLPWDCSNSVTSSGYTSNSSSLVFPPHSCSYFLQWSLETLKVIHEGLESALQTPVNVDVDLFHESWIFSMESRIVNLFWKVFSLFCPDPWEESL